MITDYIINLPTDLDKLYLDCYRNRCMKIAALFKPREEYFIDSNYINNDFQKNIVHPVVLYITMLPNTAISENSILRLEILEGVIELTLYSNYDNISGLNPDLKLLKKLDIRLEPRKNLREGYKLASISIIDKINKLRIEKDMWELLQINDSIEKTSDGFRAMRHIFDRSSLDEARLEGVFMKTIIERGFSIAYLPVCAGDSNAAYIHYSKNNMPIYNNVLLDCGARNPYGYCADITRSYPIHGRNNNLYTKVYDIVLNAKIACEKYIEDTLENGIVPTLSRLNAVCIETYIQQLPRILPRDLKVDRNIVNLFYTHFIGHHTGLVVHDIFSDFLVPGSVFTIEPGLYFNRSVVKIDINPKLFELGGIRIEDMYYITPEMTLACLSSYI